MFHIVIVHDDQRFLDEAVAAFQLAGYDAVPCPDAVAALAIIEGSRRVDLLLTVAPLGLGSLPGASLARMTRHKRHFINMLFTMEGDFAAAASHCGEVLSLPVDTPHLLSAAERILAGEVERPPDRLPVVH
jgi:DNA-binding NtrC family response regulator